ncbi:MAG: hypothetical protein KKB31_04195 [Nanoarchaeota archaeon]|nr:hypothetical protein [Nanoarchaeota archaeon]
MKKIYLGILIAFLLIASVSAYTVTRSVPSSASPSSTFQVTYQVSGASGVWGVSVVDNAAGGCLFPGGVSQLKTVMLSTDGNSKTISVTTPASGSCTFTGDSKFGTDAIVNFPIGTVTIGGSCTPNCACASSTCVGQTCSNGCSGTCPGTKDCGSIICGNGVCESGETTSNCSEDCSEIPSLSWNKVLFKIGGFEVTILVVLLIFAGLMAFSLIKK